MKKPAAKSKLMTGEELCAKGRHTWVALSRPKGRGKKEEAYIGCARCGTPKP